MMLKMEKGPDIRTAQIWWKDPTKIYLCISLPIFALRKKTEDPGIGKFRDLEKYYKEKLSKLGVKVVLILPHFAILDESPYAPVSLYALNELFIDWSDIAEVKSDPKLTELVVFPLQKIDYLSIRERGAEIAKKAFSRFKLISRETKRKKAYYKFIRENKFWLEDFADFMALHKILNKSSLEWSKKEIKKIRESQEHQELAKIHKFSQWIANLQLKETLEKIHNLGGKILFDIPMFRAKDSVDVWKYPCYFKDVETRNPGIIREELCENWKDLALWNWSELGKKNYSFLLAPIEYWLNFGFDGARYDGLHFAYYFGNGQLASSDEPGDDFVKKLAEVFLKYKALPLAEAFEGKAKDIQKHGFITIYGDWKHLSSHDDPRRYGKAEDLKQRFKELLYSRDYSGKNARFISYTLGDNWGDPEFIKTKRNGKTFWRYRIPLKGDENYKERVLFDVGSYMGLMISAYSDFLKAVEVIDMNVVQELQHSSKYQHYSPRT